jgi:CHRD domain
MHIFSRIRRKNGVSDCRMEKVLIFTENLATMKWIKLTAFSSVFFAALLALSSCEKDAEVKKTSTYQKTGIALTGAQETPATPSTAVGSMDVTYIRGSKTLSYKVTWSGLTAPPIAMHIHGLAPTGFAAPVFQTIISAPNPAFPASGSYSGTLLVDGIVVKEENLLNGLYYLNMHTPTYPGGEIRGQVRFQ